ncbi:MAG: hypothetical protein ABJN40_10350 [Sneathiella sp.]
MPNLKKSIVKHGVKFHKMLAWTGFLALLLFASSAILHPVMVWTGPRAAAFFPPQMKTEAASLQALQKIVQTQTLGTPTVAKVVPGENGPLFQVTVNPDKPRDYYSLETFEKLENQDKKQAVWLARYYTGLQSAAVKSVSFQTEFDAAYPWVNRLLPVYRIEFKTPDHRTAYIYTELGALAGHTNTWKTTLQSLFGLIHTMNWLDDMEIARLAIMAVLLVSLAGMTITGFLLVFTLKKRKIADTKRRLHKVLAYGIWLPLFSLAASGSYHLLYSSTAESTSGIVLSKPFSMAPLASSFKVVQLPESISVNELSFVAAKNGDLLIRASLPNGQAGSNVSDNKRFDGMAVEKQASYYSVSTGEKSDLTDKQFAENLARRHFRLSEAVPLTSAKVHKFGNGYDFRNKRLPVWKITLPAELGGVAYIDPANDILVDRLTASAETENFSFSVFHKWDFMTPFIGRPVRDLFVLLILLSILTTGVSGFLILIKRKKSRKSIVKEA